LCVLGSISQTVGIGALSIALASSTYEFHVSDCGDSSMET
jgi:hypothetical protein